MRKTLCVLALTVTAAAGCGGSSSGSLAPTSAPTSAPASATSAGAAGAEVLPTGKEQLALEQRTYRSPEGFLPTLTVDVPAGWSSVHRFDDAFDITQPDPARDAPAVAVIWMTPDAATAAEALAAVRAAAGAAGQPVTGRIGTTDATGIDITDGTGTVVEAARRGIAIDAEKGQRLRVIAADIGGKPLLVVVLVPVKANWDALLAKAQPLIESVRPV